VTPEEMTREELIVHIKQLAKEVLELEWHCDKFCKCPTHGPSLIQISEREF